MNKQLEALIAEMKDAAELIADGYRCEFEVIHDPENGVARLGCLDDDGELSSFVEVSVSNYSGDERHDAELADFFVKSHPANVLALIAALELAQQRVAALENDEVHQRLANAEEQLRMAELAKYNLKTSRRAQFRRRLAAERRIAELEASPLAVKLPPRIVDIQLRTPLEVEDIWIARFTQALNVADRLQDSAFRHGLQHGFSYGQTNDQSGFEQAMKAYSNIRAYKRDDVIEAFRAAGGQVEGE